MVKPLRAVQIGAGTFAHTFHGPTLQRLSRASNPPISLEAICDLDLGRALAFSSEFGYGKAYTDFQKMIEESQPDLIYCMVQPHATAGVLERIFPYLLPIFTEKPPGVSIEEAERLAGLAEEYGAVNYVAFNRRRMPGLQHLQHWAHANAPIRYVRAEMLRNRRLEPDFAIGTAIHPMDYLRYLCGEVVEVRTRCLPYAGTQARDFLVQLRFASGLVADLAVLVDCGMLRERYLVQVENSSMEVTIGTGYTSEFFAAGEAVYRNNRVVLEKAGDLDPLIAGGFVAEHEAFLDSVARGANFDCCLQNVHQSLKLAVAVQQEYSGALIDFSPRSNSTSH